VSSPPSLLQIVNNGSTALLLSGPSVTGANASDFTVTNNDINIANECRPPLGSTSLTLVSAQSCSLAVVFTPSQAGQRTATVTVTDATSGISKSTTLNGTGEPLAPLVTPNSLTFGHTAVGTVSAAQTATISAPNGDPVTFQPVTGSVNAQGDFSLSAGTCATQTPCQVSVSFQPSATGSRDGGYQVNDTVTGQVSFLSFQGTGGVATVSLSGTSLAFASRDEGTTSIAQTVTLTNVGSEALMVSGVTFIGANAGDFSLQGNTCGASVVAGGNCTISVSFDPTASGARGAILQIVSNASSSPDSVQLSGTGN
jgi:ASPM-SPD-2-Hydin domain-containing protein